MSIEGNEGVAQEPPCPSSHEEMYLTWSHQADGYSYFYCSSCKWQKPDLELGTVGKLIKAKDSSHALEMEKNTSEWKLAMDALDTERLREIDALTSKLNELEGELERLRK